MKTILFIVCLISSVFLNSAAYALVTPVQTSKNLLESIDTNEASLNEFDPYSKDAEQMLEQFDQDAEAAGISNWIAEKPAPGMEFLMDVGGCYRQSCPIWALVNKASQTMTLYIEGSPVDRFPTSTGVGGRTPNFDKHPDGRVYSRYTSNKFPGGDYNGLGNMPYAVFISGGFAIHGTPRGNWSRLGRPASHGCIRIHPDNAAYFNSLVRQYGVRNVWITVN